MVLEAQASVQGDSQELWAFLLRAISILHLFTEQFDVGAPLGLVGVSGEEESAAFLQVQIEFVNYALLLDSGH